MQATGYELKTEVQRHLFSLKYIENALGIIGALIQSSGYQKDENEIKSSKVKSVPIWYGAYKMAQMSNI